MFDPDLDPDGSYARLLTDILTVGLADLGTERSRTPIDPPRFDPVVHRDRPAAL